jgi:hypothetical protein
MLKPAPFRIVGTYDDEGTMLFSKGQKNFKDKAGCNWCHLKKPLMHRYALAKKGEVPQFSETIFCSPTCYRKRAESPNRQPQ